MDLCCWYARLATPQDQSGDSSRRNGQIARTRNLPCTGKVNIP